MGPPRSMKRVPLERAPEPRFILICEGGKTEPHYFDALKAHFGWRIALIYERGAGDPMMVAEKAVKRAREEGLYQKSVKGAKVQAKADQVWAVFDRDTHERFEEAIRRCEEGGARVGRSVPCFELWLLLHLDDFDRQDDHNQVQAQLQKKRPEYDPNRSKTVHSAELVPKVEAAEVRALRQLANRIATGDPLGRPSTTVGHLTAAMRKASKAAAR